MQLFHFGHHNKTSQCPLNRLTHGDIYSPMAAFIHLWRHLFTHGGIYSPMAAFIHLWRHVSTYYGNDSLSKVEASTLSFGKISLWCECQGSFKMTV